MLNIPAILNYPCRNLSSAGSRNVDGWGLANLEGKDAYVYREPVSAKQLSLAGFLSHEDINGHTVLSHVRHCTVGDIRLENTHPFSREWRCARYFGSV